MRERSTMLVSIKREQRGACYGTFSPRQHQSKKIHWQVKHYTGLKKLVLEEETTVFLYIWPQSVESVQGKNIKEKSSPYQSWDFSTPLAGEDRSRKLRAEQPELNWIPCSRYHWPLFLLTVYPTFLGLCGTFAQLEHTPSPRTSIHQFKRTDIT